MYFNQRLCFLLGHPGMPRAGLTHCRMRVFEGKATLCGEVTDVFWREVEDKVGSPAGRSMRQSPCLALAVGGRSGQVWFCGGARIHWMKNGGGTARWGLERWREPAGTGLPARSLGGREKELQIWICFCNCSCHFELLYYVGQS